MIGRQLIVFFGFFLVEAAIGMNTKEGKENSVFGIQDNAQISSTLISTAGFRGIDITTIPASVLWQPAVLAFPITRLDNPVTYVLVVIVLFLNCVSICSST